MENAVRTLYFDGVALKQYGTQLQPSVAAKTTPIYLDLLIFAHSCFVWTCFGLQGALHLFV